MTGFLPSFLSSFLSKILTNSLNYDWLIDKSPLHMYPDVFENASTRSVFESFSPVHTKTRKRYPLLSMRHATMYLNDVFLVYDIIVFFNLHFCPSTRKRKSGVFKLNVCSGERFWKDEFSVNVFTGCVLAVGQTGGKNTRFQAETCGKGPKHARHSY